MMNRYKQEVYMIKALDHPNIINVIEYFEDPERVYVIFELCKGGELFQDMNKRIHDHNRYTEKQAARIISQMSSAIDYLHKNNIFHRDIKPENILYVHGGENFGNGRLKIIDFGTASKFKPN